MIVAEEVAITVDFPHDKFNLVDIQKDLMKGGKLSWKTAKQKDFKNWLRTIFVQAAHTKILKNGQMVFLTADEVVDFPIFKTLGYTNKKSIAAKLLSEREREVRNLQYSTKKSTNTTKKTVDRAVDPETINSLNANGGSVSVTRNKELYDNVNQVPLNNATLIEQNLRQAQKKKTQQQKRKENPVQISSYNNLYKKKKQSIVLSNDEDFSENDDLSGSSQTENLFISDNSLKKKLDFEETNITLIPTGPQTNTPTNSQINSQTKLGIIKKVDDSGYCFYVESVSETFVIVDKKNKETLCNVECEKNYVIVKIIPNFPTGDIAVAASKLNKHLEQKIKLFGLQQHPLFTIKFQVSHDVTTTNQETVIEGNVVVFKLQHFEPEIVPNFF